MNRQARNLSQKLVTTEKTALTLMGQAYDVIENSWLALGEGSLMFVSGVKPASEVVRLMEDLQSKNTTCSNMCRTSLIDFPSFQRPTSKEMNC